MRNTLATAVTILVMVLAAPVLAGINGTWDFVFDTEAGERRASITLQADGEKVTGKVAGESGEAKITGSVSGDKIHIEFPYYSEEAGVEAVVKIDGAVSGDKITGRWEFDMYSGTFEATKAQ